MIRRAIIFLLFPIWCVVSCDSDKGEDEDSVAVTVNIEDFEVTIDENPDQGEVLGTIMATTNNGSISFSMVSQSQENAMVVNTTTGELSVGDSTLFDFDSNPIITATVEARNGSVAQEGAVTVNLNEVPDPIMVTIQDFEVTVDENPIKGDVLGSVLASTNIGEVVFSIISQSPENALTIDPSTGELTVVDASLFEFDFNPVITATVEARNGEVAQQASATINLNEVVLERTIYGGPKIVFEKDDHAIFTLEVNQDRITERVWLTRANVEGLFNIRQENSYNNNSPVDTEWAEGTTDDIDTLEFTAWKLAIDSSPPGSVGKDFVLHLISENIYIDIKFLSWSTGRSSGGGGFSYERSTPTN